MQKAHKRFLSCPAQSPKACRANPEQGGTLCRDGAAWAFMPGSEGRGGGRGITSVAAFRAELAKGWKRVLRVTKYRNRLKSYCIICHQWVSMESPGIKQHIRLSHPAAWAHKSEAADRCTGLGLRVTSLLSLRTFVIKNARAHILRCSALFQASLVELLSRKDPNGGCPHGGARQEHAGAAQGGDGDEPTVGEGSRAGRGEAAQVPLRRSMISLLWPRTYSLSLHGRNL